MPQPSLPLSLSTSGLPGTQKQGGDRSLGTGGRTSRAVGCVWMEAHQRPGSNPGSTPSGRVDRVPPFSHLLSCPCEAAAGSPTPGGWTAPPEDTGPLQPGGRGRTGTHLPGHLLVGHWETLDGAVGVEEVPGIHVVGVARVLHLQPAVQLRVPPHRGLLGCWEWEQPHGTVGKAGPGLGCQARRTGPSSMVLSPKLLGCLYLPKPGLNASPKEGTLPRAPSTRPRRTETWGQATTTLESPQESSQ